MTVMFKQPHGLPPDVFALVNHQEATKDIWDRVKLLMKGTELSYQERECRLMTMQQVQLNTKFLNALPSEWSKFATDVKLVKREDPIECINKAMAFLSDVASRFPPLNNQLRTSSNPRNQATIQDGRVTVQQVQERKNQSYVGTGNRGIATTSKGNYAAGQPRVVKCYNCQGEGHMARQCTQPKRPRNAAWFKEKLMLAEAQEAGQILDKEKLAFDAYYSNCDDLSLAKAVLMANLSSCDLEVLSEDTNSSVPNDLLVLSLVKQITDHVAHLDKENETNKMRHWILEKRVDQRLLDKQNDPISIEKKIKISPIDYSKLNKIKEYFGKRFVTKKELSAEQPFWLKHSSLSETPVNSHTPVRIKAPSELPKELLVYVSQTCPNSPKPSEKLVAVTLMNKDKRVRFAKPVTSSSNIPKQTDSLKTKDSNKPLLTSTRVKPTTSASRSKPSGNTKNNSNQKNKHSVRNAKFESICAICNKCLFDDNHDMCIIDYVNDVNVRLKSKSKRNNMRKVWKPTGKVFSEIGYSWKPIGTIRFGNDHNSKIMGYGDYQMGNVTISQAPLGKPSHGEGDLSHVNLDYINSLAKHGLVRGLPKLKYHKDHLCSANALGKKAIETFPTNQSKTSIPEKNSILCI
ncbi:integrase, catalytic region, zinc finger, CCHC-type containing protein [Tanacetum coccineum]|uniref:Integrase, catalytic region, zinc finger, CCHC-type containing protein n=1 Tax=Tanacetum coccineum TaxID=301880 RepID=A0ABQ5HZ31_9ASTR